MAAFATVALGGGWESFDHSLNVSAPLPGNLRQAPGFPDLTSPPQDLGLSPPVRQPRLQFRMDCSLSCVSTRMLTFIKAVAAGVSGGHRYHHAADCRSVNGLMIPDCKSLRGPNRILIPWIVRR